jgi:hypothetical protein
MERVAGQKLKNNMVANTSKKKWEVVGEICSVVFGAVGVILMVLGYFRICNKFITLDDRVTDLEIARTLGKWTSFAFWGVAMRANKQGTWSVALFVVILTGSLCARLFIGGPLEERLSEIEAFVTKESKGAE